MEFNLNFYILCKKQHLKKVEKELYTEPYKRLKERYIVRDYEHIIDIYRNPLLHIGNDFFNINSYL